MSSTALELDRGQAPARSRGLGRVLSLTLIVSVGLLFGLSGGSLWDIGYNYDGLTGSALTKIHPFTYLIVAAFAARTLAAGNPVATVVRDANRRPAALLLIVTGLVLFTVTLLRKGPGLAGMIDTFVGPAMMVVLLSDASGRTMERLGLVLHGLMTANALLALFEFATKEPVFPFRFDGEVFPFDLRASALQGHPLANAAVTACYILALLSGGRTLRPSLRLSMIFLQCAALVAFGGRSAMVVCVALGAIYLVIACFRTLRSGHVSLLAAAVGLVLAGLLPLALAAAAQAGFFDAILSRFVSDGGSANTRVQMFDLINAIPVGQFIVGPDIDVVESLRRTNGLEMGIENPIVRMILYQGGFLMLVTLIAVGLFLRELTRGREPGVWVPLVAFVLLLNTSESIAVKTTLLAKFAVTVLCLFRPSRARTAARFSPAAWSSQAHRGSPGRGRA